jgi:hypothetical protein
MNVYHAKSFLKQSRPDLAAAGRRLWTIIRRFINPSQETKCSVDEGRSARPAIAAAQNSSLIARQDKGGSMAF